MFDLEDCLLAMSMTARLHEEGHPEAAMWSCTAEVAGKLAAEIRRLMEIEWMYKELG